MSCYTSVLIGSMLVSGAINTLSKKYQMTTCTPGLDGKTSDACAKRNMTGEEFKKVVKGPRRFD